MPCQMCRRDVPTKFVTLQQNIGMLVARQLRTVRGNLCKRCIRKQFWRLTGLTLITGWWGMISIVVNVVVIVNNCVRFCQTFGMKEVLPGSPVLPVLEVPKGVGVGAAVAPGSRGVVPQARVVVPTSLESYRQDILIRMRGGESPQQVGVFVSPRVGLPVAIIAAYAESLRGRN